MDNIYWIVFTHRKPIFKIKNFSFLSKIEFLSTEINTKELEITLISQITQINKILQQEGFKNATCIDFKILRKE